MPRPDAVLFTAFEPSGDALAAGLIAEIKRRRPEIKIFALGGPKMAAAGAELIETTTEHAVMLAGAIGQVMEHRGRLKRLKLWLREHPIAAHVPTDSPAANWSICKLVRKLRPEAKIVHLAAPQVWAWASWRIHKLRRLTDHVLCLLPFEEKWFGERNVPATFVGHPIFDPQSAPIPQAIDFPSGDSAPKIAVLPGSRRAEIDANSGTIQATLEECHWKLGGKGFWAPKEKEAHPDEGVRVAVAAYDQKIADRIQYLWADGDPVTDFGAPLRLMIGQADQVIEWADVVLVVSGTATLQVAAHRKPMVVLYNVSRWSWNLIGRWIVGTRTFALPNLISEATGQGRAVPEFVPHFGSMVPVVKELERLLKDPAARAAQREALDRVCAPFEGVSFRGRAADRFLEILGA